MKAPFKRLSIVVLVGLLLVDCSKSSPVGLCKLQKDIEVDGPDTITSTYVFSYYQYVSQSTSSVGYSSTQTFHYGVDGIDETNLVVNGATGKTTYGYIGILMNTSISAFGSDSITTTYTYNVQDQLIKKVQRSYGSLAADTTTMEYSYPDLATKNPSSTVFTHTGAASVTTLYQYDNKVNPFREKFPSISTYNNVVRIESAGQVETISYTYNDHGYPLSATWSSGKTQTFTYTCE